MSNKLSKKAALYAFGEEKIKWSLDKCLEQIEACRKEIKKYKRPSPMWKVYHKELTNLHSLKKYIKGEKL